MYYLILASQRSSDIVAVITPLVTHEESEAQRDEIKERAAGYLPSYHFL